MLAIAAALEAFLGCCAHKGHCTAEEASQQWRPRGREVTPTTAQPHTDACCATAVCLCIQQLAQIMSTKPDTLLMQRQAALPEQAGSPKAPSRLTHTLAGRLKSRPAGRLKGRPAGRLKGRPAGRPALKPSLLTWSSSLLWQGTCACRNHSRMKRINDAASNAGCEKWRAEGGNLPSAMPDPSAWLDAPQAAALLQAQQCSSFEMHRPSREQLQTCKLQGSDARGLPADPRPGAAAPAASCGSPVGPVSTQRCNSKQQAAEPKPAG